jgi:hypothetical protein
MIGAHGFRRWLNMEGTEGFTTSLYKIDRIIDNKKRTAAEIREREDIQHILLTQYHAWTDVFMKSISDILPPRRNCDHQIKL